MFERFRIDQQFFLSFQNLTSVGPFIVTQTSYRV